MTRLQYMKMTVGQRRDIQEHLRACSGKLSDVKFDDFVAPYIGGKRIFQSPRDGLTRSSNRHGFDLELHRLPNGFRILRGDSGGRPSTYHKKIDAVLAALFKPRRIGE